MTKRVILLQALAATTKDLARMLPRTDETFLHRRPTSDQWSIADVLNHLIDVEVRYLRRLQGVVQEDHPLLPAILPDETAHDVQARRDELLARFSRARSETLAFLEGISLGDWQRSAVHETWGEIRFRFLVQHLVDHDTEHLNQIIEIQGQLPVASR
jgi:uncharacterized damage-inducible protein DinB